MDLHGGHHWIMGEHFRLFTMQVEQGVDILTLEQMDQ